MRKINFCKDWQFSKIGGPVRSITLPHDAMLEEKRNANAPSGSAGAYFVGGEYIYTKQFTVSSDFEEKHYLLQFEGVYKNSKVFVNGKEAGSKAYGYIPFFVNLDDFLIEGENEITVTVDNKDHPNSRWYTGSGIYRPVWLWESGKQYIEVEGIKVTTLSYNPAKIRVETSHTDGEIKVEILDNSEVVVDASGDNVELNVPNAKLWSEDTPYLYKCRVTLSVDGHSVDSAEVSFGIRAVTWSPNGLFVNGKETLLRGGCIHHDNGILGACSYVASEERRIRILKEKGYNAIRSSHNPAASAMLEACDRYGMYVMDETWDMWYKHKSQYDYAEDFMENYKYDIKALIDRDYNHPSVIMYSIGNEVSEPASQKGKDLTAELVNEVHSLDSTRPVTAGFNLMIIANSSRGKEMYKEEGGLNNSGSQNKTSGMSSTMFNMITSMVGTGMNKTANSKRADAATSPSLDLLDIAGYNYASGRYPLEAKAHPQRLILGSETFPQDIAKNWVMVKKYPYLVGDFMWTAWDYLGEVGLGAWAYSSDGKGFTKPYPWLLSESGVIDILGNETAEAGLASVVWGKHEMPYIGVRPANHKGVKPIQMVWRGTNALPSWSWQNCEGNKTIVEIYADAAKVELFINNKSLGKKAIKDYKAVFKVKYVSGEITAVSYDSTGNEIGRSKLESAFGKLRLTLIPEEKVEDIVYVNIAITDENGVVECNADETLIVSVEGGELLGFGSACPRTEEDFLAGSYTTYYGRAQAVVRVGKEPVTMKVWSKSYEEILVIS